MTSQLKEKTVKSVIWVLGEKFGTYGITFFTGIILARLLSPSDYGLIGMITIFLNLAESFVQSGLGIAYIQKKEVDDTDANTVFYTNLFVSILFVFFLWISAPLIAGFFEQPQLIKLTRILSFVILINAFNIIQSARLTRSMDFKRQTKLSIVSVAVSGGAGVAAAFYGLGVWSLVIQRLVNRFLFTTGLWSMTNWKPSLNFSFGSFKNMFSFGGWILAISIVSSIFENLYKIVIGKFFPAAQLGYYTKSQGFQELASKNLSGAVQSVALPVLSRIQDDIRKMQDSIRKFLTHIMVFIVPIMVTFMIVAEPFVILLLTEKWAPMIPYLKLFCVIGIIHPISSINDRVLLSQGKSRLIFILYGLKSILRILNVILMYRYGVIYILLGEIIVSVLALFLNSYYTHLSVNYGFFKQFDNLKYIILAGFLGGMAGYLVTFSIDNLLMILILGTISTFGIYIGFIYLFNRAFFYEILSLKAILITRK